MDEPSSPPLITHVDGVDPDDRRGKTPRKKIPVTYVVLTLLVVGGTVRWLSRRAKASSKHRPAALAPPPAEPPPPPAEPPPPPAD